MGLTASQVLGRLGSIVQNNKSQSDQARYLLPFILLMRLDSKLKPTRGALRQAAGEWDAPALLADATEQTLEAMEAREITGHYFYNISTYDLPSTKSAQDALTRIKSLVQGFSPRVRTLLIDELDILKKAGDLQKSKSLFRFLGELADLQRETEALDDRAFGRLLSNLLQRLSEGTNDDASECATPQDVVDLMVRLLPRTGDEPRRAGATVYDPTYGTAGLLVHAASHVRQAHHGAEVRIQGHEKRGEMHALGALSALLQVSTYNGTDPADAGAVGEVVDLINGHSLKPEARRASRDDEADYAVCNPPQGKSGKWSDVKKSVDTEAEAEGSRFAAGTPGVGDASLLFLQQIVDRLNEYGRAVLVLNGSPLFAGQVSAKGGNEQSIRAWMLDKDYLDAIIGLPPNVHFNTDIPTYLWVLDKNRPAERAGRVVLVNASGRPGTEAEQLICFATNRKKNQNKKRFDLTVAGLDEIVAMVRAFQDVDREDEHGNEVPLVRVLPTEDFRFRVVKVYRPLRLHIHITNERLGRLSAQKAWTALSEKDNYTWNKLYDALRARLGYETNDVSAFDSDLKDWAKVAGLKTPSKTVRSAIWEALGERNLSAMPLRDSKGQLVADSELTDEERVPWNEDTAAYIDREVRPFVPEVDRDLLWTDDAELPGAEIPFNRIFYRYEPPRSLTAIGRDIRRTRKRIDALLDELEDDLAELEPPTQASLFGSGR